MPHGNKGRSIIGGSLLAPATQLARAGSVGDVHGAEHPERGKNRVCRQDLLYLSGDEKLGIAH